MTQRVLPSGVQPLEVTVEAHDGEQVAGEFEEMARLGVAKAVRRAAP